MITLPSIDQLSMGSNDSFKSFSPPNSKSTIPNAEHFTSFVERPISLQSSRKTNVCNSLIQFDKKNRNTVRNDRIVQREIPISLTSGRMMNYSMPMFPISGPFNSICFEKVCSDPTVVINPQNMQFIPETAWGNQWITFGCLVSSFFHKRNSMHCKFPIKLYNALKITQFRPDLLPYVGVEWITETVFRVHRDEFARLIGVRAIDGGLFHQQGNFPSHGFRELSFAESNEISTRYGLGRPDLSKVRFIRHSSPQFNRFSSQIDMEDCKWIGK